MRWRKRAIALAVVACLASGGPAFAPAGAAVVDDTAAPPDAVQDTVVVLEEPVAPQAIAAALNESGARIVAMEHERPKRGGFYARNLDNEDAVAAYRAAFAAWHGAGAEPEVFAFRVRGIVEPRALGALAENVLHASIVPANSSVAVANVSEGGSVTVVNSSPGESNGSDPDSSNGDSGGSGDGEEGGVAPANVIDKKPWAPERGFQVGSNNSGACFPGIISCAEARRIDLYLTFDRANPGNDFRPDWAYEHDFKLYNDNNMSVPREVCPPWQRNDFWADADSGIAWETTMPNPYLDTPASDDCRFHDLTVGSFRPDRFVTRTYDINLIVAPGDNSWSDYALSAQVLDKDCEFSPWCVGIGGSAEGQPIINAGAAQMPGCRSWVAGEGHSAC